MSSDNINCHYVSESLTKAWENEQGKLYFYDFSSKTIDQLRSRDLFARRGLNSRPVEEWLRDNVESPLGRFRKALRKRTGPVPTEIDDLPAYRALMLLLPLQVVRIAKVESGPGELDQIFEWPPQKLDQFLSTIRSNYALVVVQGHPKVPLFFTEHGFFMLPFPWASIEHAAAAAMPLNEWEAVVALPRSMDRSVVSRILTQGEGYYLNNCSIGTNANRVVIHPGIIEAMGNAALIAEIETIRSRNRDCFKSSWISVNLLSQAIAAMGTG